jgi:hypothetical protein
MHTRKRLWLFALAALLVVGLAAAVHADPPPAPWTARDISAPLTPGIVDVDRRGLWFVRAHTGDIGLSQPLDSFFFVSQPLSSDGSVLALLLGQDGGNPDAAKAGVMIRENDTVGARNILLAMTPGHGLLLSFRPTARRSTVSEGADQRYGLRQFPTWLRLQREGDQFTPFASYDGYGWSQLHAPIALSGFPSDALAGLAVSSFVGEPTTAVFDNPTVAPGEVSPLVQACAGNGAVLLTWPPVSHAVGYRVRRSTPATPGFAADLLTPAPITESSFSDTRLPNDKPVRYLVSPIFEQGGRRVEGMATAVTTTPVATPANLFGCDINLEITQMRGAVAFDPATSIYTISGAGGGIGETEDHGFLASQLVRGDFQITARILGKPSRTMGSAAAGLMVREALDGPARMAALLGTFRDGVAFQWRGKRGAAASSGTPAIGDKDFQPPLYVRLVRKGDTMTPLLSTDGTTFTPAGEPRVFDPPLTESLYVGYAITSQSPGEVATSTFRDLTIGPPP